MGKAPEVLIQCLEAEGIRFVFGIPGEETLDLNESLDRSSIEFVPVRHEQGAAFIADVYGWLTGRCVSRDAGPGGDESRDGCRGRVLGPIHTSTT
jgi:thiamine pyrophosphate-dependent acetolactate synthase large subunit-like protein